MRTAQRIAAVLVTPLLLVAAACGDDERDGQPTTATTSDASRSSTTLEFAGAVGPILFNRRIPGSEEESSIYTASLDGRDVELLFAGPAQHGGWSPDGTEISVFCCDDETSGRFLNVETGEVRTIPQPDPDLQSYCGGVWSPDGERVLCEVFGIDDPELNGIYMINAADGSDLTRITSNPDGNDFPGDYSPDGNRVVFMRFENEQPVGLFVTNIDGSGLRQLPTGDLLLDGSGHAGRWSPSGDRILFVARTADDLHMAIWVVSADGGEPQQLPITPTCGGPFEPGEHGCYSPSWSPDGTQIAFTRSDDVDDAGIFVVNADGTGLVQVTDGVDDYPDWGP